MKILVVSHDAGGAEIVSSWVRQNPKNEYDFILEEPAKKIFYSKIPDVRNSSIVDLSRLVKNADFVLTGTSESADLEKRAILFSQKMETESATFLDYWYGFRKRFLLDDMLVFPGEIWVGDNYALELAKKELPEANIVLKSNPYFDEITKDVNTQENKLNKYDGTLKILYLCQPYNQVYQDEHGDKKILTDKIALEYFFQILTSTENFKVEIWIRQHPLENFSKYKKIIGTNSAHLKIKMSINQKLSQDLLWADIVVGMHAQALAVAVAMEKNVFHCIPKGAQPCALPHSEIRPFEEQGINLITEYNS
jgi:hypothetical protein